MPGPVYQTSTTSTYTSAGATSHPVTINKPSGVSDGDVLILSIGLRQDDGVGRTLSTDLVFDAAYPWTKIREATPYNTSSVNRTWLYIRYIDNAASEPASYTCTVNYAGAFSVVVCTISARFSGAGPLSPINQSTTYLDSGLSSITFPQITTTLPDTLILFSGYARNAQTTFTFSSATSIALVGVTLTASANLALGYLLQPTTGLSVSQTGTWGNASSSTPSTTTALASDLVASTSWIQA